MQSQDRTLYCSASSGKNVSKNVLYIHVLTATGIQATMLIWSDPLKCTELNQCQLAAVSYHPSLRRIHFREIRQHKKCKTYTNNLCVLRHFRSHVSTVLKFSINYNVATNTWSNFVTVPCVLLHFMACLLHLMSVGYNFLKFKHLTQIMNLMNRYTTKLSCTTN